MLVQVLIVVQVLNKARKIILIVNELGNRVVQYQLLPYRQMGTEKYKSLNRPYPMEDFEGYEREEWEPDLARFLDLLIDMGINAVTGNNKHMPLGK